MKFVIVLSLATAAIAQTTSTTGTTGVISGAIGPAHVVMPNGSVSFASAGPGLPGGTVTGMPYSAEEVTEHVQTLADGTHITQPSRKAMFYRDSQGRTRIERTFPMPQGVPEAAIARPSLIEINDPVSGAHYTLNSQNHTARKMSFPTELPAPPPPSSANGSGALFARRVPAGTAIAQQSNSDADGHPQRPQFSRESLGTQMIEGILAEGTRTTVVYPVGMVGNDRPITNVHEAWMSPELKTVVLSKNSDPRSGESTTKLINISRTEPDPALFQIPADYEVIDAQTTGPNR